MFYGITLPFRNYKAERNVLQKWLPRLVFQQNQQENDLTSEDENDNQKLYLEIPYVGKSSRKFFRNMSDLCLEIAGLKLVPLYKTMKASNYFHLKSMTPLGLCSNIVYFYTCPCDTGLTYLGMSSKHLVTRAKEHLDLNQLQKSAIKGHILDCVKCSNSSHSLASFKILRNCKNEYDTKVYEALLIKKFKPKLNRQLYANGCSILFKGVGSTFK